MTETKKQNKKHLNYFNISMKLDSLLEHLKEIVTVFFKYIKSNELVPPAN